MLSKHKRKNDAFFPLPGEIQENFIGKMIFTLSFWNQVENEKFHVSKMLANIYWAPKIQYVENWDPDRLVRDQVHIAGEWRNWKWSSDFVTLDSLLLI